MLCQLLGRVAGIIAGHILYGVQFSALYVGSAVQTDTPQADTEPDHMRLHTRVAPQRVTRVDGTLLTWVVLYQRPKTCLPGEACRKSS